MPTASPLRNIGPQCFAQMYSWVNNATSKMTCVHTCVSVRECVCVCVCVRTRAANPSIAKNDPLAFLELLQHIQWDLLIWDGSVFEKAYGAYVSVAF